MAFEMERLPGYLEIAEQHLNSQAELVKKILLSQGVKKDLDAIKDDIMADKSLQQSLEQQRAEAVAEADSMKAAIKLAERAQELTGLSKDELREQALKRGASLMKGTEDL